MSMNDPLAAGLSKLMNAARAGKTQVEVSSASKFMERVIEILKTHDYVVDYTVEDDPRGRRMTISLSGEINEVGPIKPRFAVTTEEFEKFEKRYLPARDFGFLIVSTSKGLMTHLDAKQLGVGGRLIAYCY